MIKEKNVILLKISYFKDTNLAKIRHMYICKNASDDKYSFLKCQTLKPYMLTNSPITHYIDETPNIKRNPFVNITRIDCDKVFVSEHIYYPDSLLTTSRPDICDELYDTIQDLIRQYEPETVTLDIKKLLAINPETCYSM